MENGWVKLHRKIVENPISKRPQYLSLWIHLLVMANHKKAKMMWNGEILSINEGQFVTGRKELSEKTGIPETTIEDILKFLERQQQIRQQKTTKFRLITVINWEKYQFSDTKSDNKPTTERQQADTNKKNNNNKNEKKLNTSGSSDPRIPEAIKLFEKVNPSVDRLYGRTNQREACERLLKKWSLDQLKAIVHGVLPELNATRFAKGKSITPIQLEENLGYIKAFIDQKCKPDDKRKVAIINMD